MDQPAHPLRIGSGGRRLVSPESLIGDIREDEVFRLDWRARETSQKRNLAGMRHGVGERTLQELSRAQLRRECGSVDLRRETSELVMESVHFFVEGRQGFGAVHTPDEERVRI